MGLMNATRHPRSRRVIKKCPFKITWGAEGKYEPKSTEIWLNRSKVSIVLKVNQKGLNECGEKWKEQKAAFRERAETLLAVKKSLAVDWSELGMWALGLNGSRMPNWAECLPLLRTHLERPIINWSKAVKVIPTAVVSNSRLCFNNAFKGCPTCPQGRRFRFSTVRSQVNSVLVIPTFLRWGTTIMRLLRVTPCWLE